MEFFRIFLLIVLQKAIIGFAVLSPKSPEPLSHDFDIVNLMFFPPDHPISPKRDNDDALAHQPQNEQVENRIEGKHLAQHYKAKYMREYRIRKKSESDKQQVKSITGTLSFIERRRKLQKESYKRLKEKRGYGKINQMKFKDLRQKVKDGIPMTSDEKESFKTMYDAQQKHYKKKMSKRKEKQT